MQKHTKNIVNHDNKDQIIKFLREFEELHTAIGDIHRAHAYRVAIANILNNAPITAGMSKKITEYLSTGHSDELLALRAKAKSYQILTHISGVGTATATNWIKLGVSDLTSLRRAIMNGVITLNQQQSYGLKYYKDLNMRIPRDEVAQISDKIKKIIMSLYPKTLFTICGSYRRGQSTSGDVDILISDTDLSVIEEAIAYNQNYIATINSGNDKLTILFMHNGICRQVDIFNTRVDNYYTNLVYLTGSKDFEQSLRGYAKKLGYKLNQYGLIINGKIVPVGSEQELFAKLGLKYIPPNLRNTGVKLEKI